MTSLALACALTGCSSHEPSFEKDAPPQAESGPSEQLRIVTANLIERQADRLSSLPADALAPLVSGAALSFQATGSPRMLTLARRYWEALLEARVAVADGSAFFSARSSGKPDAAVSAAAGLAALDLFSATREATFAEVARAGARAVMARQLGWTESGDEAWVRRSGSRRGDIALTAGAFALLDRTAVELDAGTSAAANRALRTIERNQAAVGRWWSQLGQPRSPMTLIEWASTLDALVGSKHATAQGIAGGGIPALFETAFQPDGSLRRSVLTQDDPTGMAVSLDAFARFAELRYSKLVATRILEALDRGRDVSGGDATASAYLAMALARHELTLTRAAGD